MLPDHLELNPRGSFRKPVLTVFVCGGQSYLESAVFIDQSKLDLQRSLTNHRGIYGSHCQDLLSVWFAPERCSSELCAFFFFNSKTHFRLCALTQSDHRTASKPLRPLMHLLIKMFLFPLPVKRTQPAAAGSEAAWWRLSAGSL